MKNKIIISALLVIGALAFLYKDEFSSAKTEKVPVQESSEIIRTISKERQTELLDYLASAKYYKLESESDFKESETGTVISDRSEFGKGENVIFCNTETDKPGYVLKGADFFTRSDSLNSKWLNDTLHQFYINTRLRIKRDLIIPRKENYNDQNIMTPIGRLEIVNIKGKVIIEVEITAKDFIGTDPDDPGRMDYSGDYLESFGGRLQMDSLIIFSGKDLNPDGKISAARSKVDYRIYWYGFTDVWIDHVIVKNDVARDLLNGDYDSYLSSMTDIENIDFKNFKSTQYPLVCYDYILKKIQVK
ncbi:MAG: hypothetical protein WAT71_16085 [Ignavibacteria bacterium]